jgi:hypothetical protein
MDKKTASTAKDSSKLITKNVELFKKNPETWKIISGPRGQYSYKLVGTKISGIFNGYGLADGIAYTLVSYKGGDKIVVLGTGMANVRGDLQIINDLVDVGTAQAWTGDYMGQPAGYKIWLVPAANIAGEKLAWHPNLFLFETSLAR